ncbi:MAG: cbb3-type cytochrome c oxidase subunit I [Acidimicrobiia bacterium]
MPTVTERKASPAPSGRGRSRLLGLVASEQADSAARRHLAVAALFLVVAVFLGLLTFFQARTPGLGSAFLAYGRVRPMYTNAAIFGWLGLGGMSVVYYLTPRLTGVRLWGESLANANLWLSVLAYAVGIASLGLGLTDGRTLLEFPLWLDPVVAVTLAVPALVVTRTVARGRERNLYVSLWYLLAAPWWGLLLYLAGNLPGLSGVGSAVQNWFFAGNVLGLWLAGLAVGAAYYVVPKATGNPLHSHALALVGFWSLAFTQPWTGQSGAVHGPGPDWLETVAIVFSVALLIPILAVVANLAATMRGEWEMLDTSFALRFALLGAVSYVLVGVMGAFQATRSAASVIGLTPWEEGTFSLALFGVLTSFVASFIYYAWPRLIGRDWFRFSLGEWHFRLTAGGVLVMTVALWAAGLISGYNWAAGASTGAFANTGEGFAQSLAGVGFFSFLATLGMAAVSLGQGLFVFHLYRTYTSGPAIAQEMLVTVDREPEVG